MIEVWWQDEAQIGQKNGISRRWARKGMRPSAPQDQRTASVSLFGAICPKAGKAAGLVLPRCTTAAMKAHLSEISQAVAPGAHAILILDKAGWHTTAKLALPANVSLLPVPPRCPELNPTENIWQHMRDNGLSNLIFDSYDDILNTCCEA